MKPLQTVGTQRGETALLDNLAAKSQDGEACSMSIMRYGVLPLVARGHQQELAILSNHEILIQLSG